MASNAPQTETGSPATQNAPSVSVPLGFIVFGLLALVGVGVVLILRPSILSTYHYNQHVVATTHLAVLGWIGSVVFGTLYQLVPVVLETRLHSERLAKLHLGLHIVGSLGMVWSFWHWNLKHVGHWGSAFALGVALLVWNLGRTILRSRSWTPISAGIASALAWLTLAVTVGLAVAAGKCSYESIEGMSAENPLAITLRGLEMAGQFVARFDQMSLMHAHAHLGVVGCFVLLIVTLSFKLLPMFLLSHVRNWRKVWWIIGMLNLAMVGLTVTLALRNPLKLLFAGILVGTLVLYAIEVYSILRSRQRRGVDWPLRVFLSSLTVALPLIALALVLSWPGLPLTVFTGQLENLYGFLGLFGLVSSAILGMLFKILPFLVWYGTYSKHLGHAKVPTFTDMYSDRLLSWGMLFYALSLVMISTGILVGSNTGVRWGGIAMVAGLLILGMNFASILTHLIKPRLEPYLTAPGAAH